MHAEHAPARPCPWDEGRDNAWDVYGDWERWMVRHLDDALPHYAPSFLDSLDTLHKAHLYNLMGRLAGGDFDRPAWRDAATAPPAGPEIALVMLGDYYAIGLFREGHWRLYEGTPVDPSHWMPLPPPPPVP